MLEYKPIFYAKIDLDMLNSISIGEINMKEIDIKNRSFDNLPKPHKGYEVKIDVKEYDKTKIYKIGLNPQYAVYINDCLYIGFIYEFEDREGLWCIINECNSCYRGSHGLPRIEGFTELNGCNSENCCNNYKFRNEMIATNRFI